MFNSVYLVDEDGNGEADDDDEYDVKEYRNFLAKIFPSKYMSEKAEATSPSKKTKKEEVKDSKKENKKDRDIYEKEIKNINMFQERGIWKDKKITIEDKNKFTILIEKIM